MKYDDISALYTDDISDYDCSTYEYRWLAKWTAKSLIITADRDCDMPLAYKENKYVIPRKKAEEHLAKYGHIRHARKLFNPQPWAVRNPEEAERVWQHKEVLERLAEEYESLTQTRKDLIAAYASKLNVSLGGRGYSFDPEGHWKGLNQWIDEQGEAIVRAKITGKTYRSIDDQ